MAAGLLLHGIGGPRGAWGRSPDEERLLNEVCWENIVNHFEGFLLHLPQQEKGQACLCQNS